MRAIICAGGKGTRLGDLTKITNKHLLGIFDQPMIYYPLNMLKKAGIEDIMIVTGPEFSGDFIRILGNGEQFGINITYRFQAESDGIAGAIKMGKDFCGDSPVVVVLGDNLFEYDISNAVKEYEKDHGYAKVFLKEVSSKDAKRFGIATIKDNRIVEIVEKPQEPETNLAVVGLYLYNPSVFSVIDNLEKSDRGEYEVSSINQYYIDQGLMKYEIISGFWQDMGTPESLFKASEFVKNNKLMYNIN